MYICIYRYIYKYLCMYIYTYVYIYVYGCRYGCISPCAPKWFDSRVSYPQNDETLSRISPKYLSKANLPSAIN